MADLFIKSLNSVYQQWYSILINGKPMEFSLPQKDSIFFFFVQMCFHRY